MIVDAALRRQLRKKLGSRTQRRAGVKSHKAMKPRARLALAIDQWARERAQQIGGVR